VLDNGQAI